MSPIEEVRQATSGFGPSYVALQNSSESGLTQTKYGQSGWQPYEGIRYWKALDILLAKHEVRS